MSQAFAGRVALVTGSGNGIGRAIALQLAAGGATVGVNDLKPEFVERVCREIGASGGRAIGVVENAWDAFADDQLGLMDHLGIREFLFIGYCIGGCFAGKMLQRAPQRVVAAVFCQTVGHRPEDPDVMDRHSRQNWLPGFQARRPEVSTETIEKYFHSLYRVQPDFLYSVPRAFISNCRTPMLVLPDDTDSHPLGTSIDVASLAPNAEITVFPWREPPELKARTIKRVRTFLKSHVPMRNAAQ